MAADRDVKAVALEAAQTEAASTRNPDLIVKLKRPFKFEGEEITEIDLNGLAGLTAKDLQEIDDYIIQRKDSRNYMTIFVHPHYMYYLAFMASGYPIEAFQAMPIRTFRQIEESISDYMGLLDEFDEDTGIVPLQDPFKLNGREVNELDLGSVMDASGLDTENARQIVRRQKNYRKYQNGGWDVMHQMYQFAFAANAAGCRPEELNALSWRDALRVRMAVISFLYD